MIRYVARRLLVILPTAILVVVVVFLILHLAPGDPAALIAGDGADQATIESIRRNLGLDEPLPEQLRAYVWNLLQLDLGQSIVTRAPVLSEIWARLPNSLLLATTSLLIAAVIGIPLGLFTARRVGSAWDLGGRGLAAIFVSAPVFWLGMLLIQLFALRLMWLPVAGIGGWKHLVLPAMALAAGPLALIARLVRSETLEVSAEDYMRTARGKGLSERLILYRHVLKNTLLPVLTVIALQFGSAFNGAVVIEVVFAWPGVGRLLIDSILNRDYPVVQGGILIVALGFLLVNLSADILYAYVDPRIRYDVTE